MKILQRILTIMFSAMMFIHSQQCSAFRLNGFLARRAYSSTLVVLSAKKQTAKTKRIGEFWEAKMDGVWRPDVNDVERISWGKPAKKKGTGSRGVPHRLNNEERFLFDNARRKGFLEVEGSGWRSQRRDAPLLNTYRSLCDARGQVSIVLHKGNTGLDELVVDISPLRHPEIFHRVAQVCLKHQEGGETMFQGRDRRDEALQVTIENVLAQDPAMTQGIAQDRTEDETSAEISSWEVRPIYQLPPYFISWELPRNEAKILGKKMAKLFDTIEETASPSRKPVGVKPGKGRQHGGYGIG
jgi:hypothetical protein